MSSEQELKIMKARAAKLAEPIIAHDASQDVEFVLFALGESQQYGIAYEFVEGIIKPDKVALVPCAPGAIAGVVSWRGNLLAVVDLSVLLGMPPQAAKQRPWIVVVQSSGKRLGLLVSVVMPSQVFSRLDLRPAAAQQSGYIHGVIAENIAILNMESLFSSKDLML